MKCIALLFVAILATGCITQRVADLTLVSDYNVSGLPAPVGEMVTAELCRFGAPSIDGAILRAQDKAGVGNALADVSIDLRQELWVIFVRNCYIVRGKPINIE